MMYYSQEDYNFIKTWLDKCITIKKDNNIYYVTSDNIIRQLKYNRILSKKEIKVDLTKLDLKNNVILRYNLKSKCFYINYYIIWKYFELNYLCLYSLIRKKINTILCDILKINLYSTINRKFLHIITFGYISKYKEFKTITYSILEDDNLNHILNLNNLTINNI